MRNFLILTFEILFGIAMVVFLAIGMYSIDFDDSSSLPIFCLYLVFMCLIYKLALKEDREKK